MTLYEFRTLNETQQYEILWEHGVHIDEKVEGEYKIILYQIFSFYVELFYHIEKNVLQKLRCFSSTNCLDQYINKIDINKIK